MDATIKVPKTPEPKHITMASNDKPTIEISIDGERDERSELIFKVMTFDKDIQSFESRIKNLQEQAQEMVENTDEYSEIQELESQLKIAREELKRKMQNNREYIDVLTLIGEEKDALKAAKENMSEFLLAYFAETKEKQIELSPKMAREVVIKAKLGKEKLFQSSLFGGDNGSRA